MASSSGSTSSSLFLLTNICNLVSVRLDSQNYLLWSFQISPLLRAHDLFGHLDGSTVEPVRTLPKKDQPDVPNPEFRAWFEKDQAIMTLIGATLTQNALSYVVGGGRGKTTPNSSNNNHASSSVVSNNVPVTGADSTVSPHKVTCQICNRFGHNALDCYNRMNFSFQGRLPPARLAAMAASTSSQTVNPNVASSSGSNSTVWLSDSGCNAHLAQDFGNFNTSTAYNGEDNITIGNGQNLTISHAGSGTNGG